MCGLGGFGLTAGCSWSLMFTVRNGELVVRRLSHSLGRGSGTDSMKVLFSSLMLLWCRMVSVWVLSRSFNSSSRRRGRRWQRCFNEMNSDVTSLLLLMFKILKILFHFSLEFEFHADEKGSNQDQQIRPQRH